MPESPVFDALCIGEAMLMVTPEDPVPLRQADRCVLRAGGSESNVAAYLARLGHRSAWASRLGDDPPGELVRDVVARSGADVSLVEVAPAERTGVYFKDPTPGGTRVYYYRNDSAASRMSPLFLSALTPVRARVIHVSGITPALSESCAALTDELLLGRAFGDVPVSFDVNFRPGLWHREAAAPELLRLARAADVVFVGLDEARELWGTGTAAEVRRLLSSPRWLIVKDAARVAYEFGTSGDEEVAAFSVDVVEPVGAGDAFAAGWLSGWLRTLPSKGRLRLGHVVAASAMSSTSDEGELPDETRRRTLVESTDEDWLRLSTRPRRQPRL